MTELTYEEKKVKKAKTELFAELVEDWVEIYDTPYYERDLRLRQDCFRAMVEPVSFGKGKARFFIPVVNVMKSAQSMCNFIEAHSGSKGKDATWTTEQVLSLIKDKYFNYVFKVPKEDLNENL